jgi:hypothetical protein
MSATKAHPTTSESEHSEGSDFFTEFAKCCAGIRDGREIETRYKRLSLMSDRELAKLGLTRAEVPFAALTGKGRPK